MKHPVRLIALCVLLICGRLAFSQQAQSQTAAPAPPAAAPTADQDAPVLTLEEKITLVTDDVKRADAFEKAQNYFKTAVKPIDEHQTATKKVIEDEHPGWTLENGADGWHFVKKVEPAKPPEKK